jgi:D-cysteine desulfhydrase
MTRVPYPERIALAQLPTPLQRLDRLGAALGVELWVKRDDLTGVELSGNKVRKLEFLLAEALAQGADTVVTCGGAQSNHCRATALAAARLGLRSRLLLRVPDPRQPPPPEANILLDRLAGADIQWVSREEYARRAELLPRVAEELRRGGRRPYLIPEGGSNALGAWGYVRAVEELRSQLSPGPTTLVYAAGSGGTGAGLLLGCRLHGLGEARLLGVNVCDDRAYFVRAIGEIVEDAIQRWHLDLTFSRDEIEILDGFVGRGYAQSRPEELALLAEIARNEGVVLDPVYTIKAFLGLKTALTANARAFGPRVIFFHTGGIYGLFAKSEEIAAALGETPG